MRKKILINLAVLIAILAIFLPNSYLVAGSMGWAEPRKPGDPLDGYWYMSGNDAPGCFEDLVVYKIEHGTFSQIFRGNTLEAPVRSSTGQELIIEFRTVPGVTSRFYVEDRGQVLWAYRYEEQSNGESFTEDSGMPLFTTCDKPSTLGVLASLVSKVFDPAAPTKKVTISRSHWKSRSA